MITLSAIVIVGRDWLIPALILAAVAIAALIWSWRETGTSRRTAPICAGLKLLGVLLLALALMEPIWAGQRAKPGANLFGIIVDNSQSMTVKDGGATRAENVREWVAGNEHRWRAQLEEDFQVRRYTFDSRLEHTKDFAQLNFNGSVSSLANALRTAAEQWRGQPVAGVLLFTDGNATDIRDELPDLTGFPPVYPVIANSRSRLNDLALRKVTMSQTAFEDAPVNIQASVRASGFSGSDVVATLTEVAVQDVADSNRTFKASVSAQSNTVASLTSRARGAESDLTFRFKLQPDQPGIHVYSLDIASGNGRSDDAGEATLVNNRRMLVVDRGQQPFRVLYVSGRPNWEYKFLNRAIQEDHQVQMVSLIRVAKREPKFEFKGRAGESSNPLFRGFNEADEERARYDQPVLVRLNTKDELELRGGFPKTAGELFQYHALILDDVEAEFFTRDQLSLIQQFVSERGGGFLMLGGAESFREGDYAGTPIASLLPVYVDRPVEVHLPSQLRLTLSREGWLQPWTRLRPTESEENERLETMPAFEVFNPVRDVKPGASVLATVSDPDGRNYPALVVQRFGLGRTAALTVGDLWRWGLRDETMQKDLGRSWRQLVRWLVADVPARITVAVEPSESGDASAVRLRVKARDEDFKPIESANVTLNLRRIVAAGENNVSDNLVQLPAEPVVNEPGTFDATYIARDPGAYMVEASVADSANVKIGSAVAAWASEPDAEEFQNLEVNRALLENIARKTGGEVIDYHDLENFAKRLPKERAPVMEATSTPLWHRPEVLALALGCFLVEWGLRRRKGLP